jgi:hypothetical protein
VSHQPLTLFFCFSFWWYWGLNSGQAFYHLSHAPNPFALVYFLKRVSHICLPQPVIL